MTPAFILAACLLQPQLDLQAKYREAASAKATAEIAALEVDLRLLVADRNKSRRNPAEAKSINEQIKASKEKLDLLKKRGLAKPSINPLKADVGDIGQLDNPSQGAYIVLQVKSNTEVLVQYEYSTFSKEFAGGSGAIEYGSARSLKYKDKETRHEGAKLWLSKVNTVGLKLGEPANFNQSFYISGTRIVANALKERESFLTAEAFNAPSLDNVDAKGK